MDSSGPSIGNGHLETIEWTIITCWVYKCILSDACDWLQLQPTSSWWPSPQGCFWCDARDSWWVFAYFLAWGTLQGPKKGNKRLWGSVASSLKYKNQQQTPSKPPSPKLSLAKFRLGLLSELVQHDSVSTVVFKFQAHHLVHIFKFDVQEFRLRTTWQVFRSFSWILVVPF